MNLKQIEKFFKIQCWFDGINISTKELKDETHQIKADALAKLEPGSEDLTQLYDALKKVWGSKYGFSLDKCKKEISVIQTNSEHPVKLLKLTFIFSEGPVSYLRMITEFPYELKGVGVFTDAQAMLRFGDLETVKKKLDKVLTEYCLTIPIVSGYFQSVDIPASDLIKFYEK